MRASMRPGQISPGILLAHTAISRDSRNGFNEARADQPGNTRPRGRRRRDGADASMRPGQISPGIPEAEAKAALKAMRLQ